jgi:hypothetical protein
MTNGQSCRKSHCDKYFDTEGVISSHHDGVDIHGQVGEDYGEGMIRGGCLGQVIRVLRNSGNDQIQKNTARKFGYLQNSRLDRFGLSNLPEIYNQSIHSNTHNFA